MKLLEVTPFARLHNRLFTFAYRAHEGELDLISRLPSSVRRISPTWPYPPVLAIDVGAGVGPYARELMRHCDFLVLIEPNQDNAAYLRRVFGGKAQVLEVAAANARGNGRLVDNDGSGWRRPLAKLVENGSAKPGWQQPCSTDTIDNMLDHLGLLGRSGGLIAKIDVEGVEMAVLQGMTRALADRPALLIVEIEPRLNPGYADVFTFLAAQGFSCFVYARNTLRPAGVEDARKMIGLTPGRFARFSRHRSNYIFLR